MLKQVYKTDNNGYLKEIYVKEFDEQGNCLEELTENIITVDPPQGLYRAKWTGVEWAEDMAQDEIDALNNHPHEPTEVEILQQELAGTNAMVLEFIEIILMGGM